MAARLSKQHQIPHADLDDVFWEEKYTVERAAQQRDAYLSNLLGGESWIIEGAYFEPWLEPVLSKADQIIFIQEQNLCLISWRVLRRFAARRLGQKPRTSENLRSVLQMIRWTRGIIKHRRYEEFIQHAQDKVIVLKGTQDIQSYLHNDGGRIHDRGQRLEQNI